MKNRQIAWLSPLENPTHVNAGLPIRIRDARAITDKPTVNRVLTKVIDGGILFSAANSIILPLRVSK